MTLQEPEQTADIKTPVGTLHLTGRDTIIVLLVTVIALTIGGVNYWTHQEALKDQQKLSNQMERLANEQQFAVCIMWVLADKNNADIDEALLRRKCWWIRKDKYNDR